MNRYEIKDLDNEELFEKCDHIEDQYSRIKYLLGIIIDYRKKYGFIKNINRFFNFQQIDLAEKYLKDLECNPNPLISDSIYNVTYNKLEDAIAHLTNKIRIFQREIIITRLFIEGDE